MEIVNSVLLTLIFCLAPALVLWLCQRIPLLNKLGPIMVLYALGILIGNIGWKPEHMPLVQEITTSATIPLAIPMMLFACRFTFNEASLQLRVCISGFLSVFVAILAKLQQVEVVFPQEPPQECILLIGNLLPLN